MSIETSKSGTVGGLPRSICVQWLWTDPVDTVGDTNDENSNNTGSNQNWRRVDPTKLDEQTGGLYTMRTALILLGPAANGAKDRQDNKTVPIVTVCVKAAKVSEMKRGAAQLKVSYVFLVYLAELSCGGWRAMLVSFKFSIPDAFGEKTVTTPFILADYYGYCAG